MGFSWWCGGIFLRPIFVYVSRSWSLSFHGCGMGLCAEAPGIKAAVSTTELYRNEEREIKVHEFFIVGYTPVAVSVCVWGVRPHRRVQLGK